MSKDSGESKENTSLKRKLTSRHLSMIAIGGSIGTGLFLAMGGTIRDAGPGGAVVVDKIMGARGLCMRKALGEMGTKLPKPGGYTS